MHPNPAFRTAETNRNLAFARDRGFGVLAVNADDGPLLSHADMHDMLDRQSAAYEARLAPKPPWTTAKMTPEVLTRMIRQILPFRLHIAEVSGTWKLNQNKTAEARQSAADQITSGLGSELEMLRELMRKAD